MSTDNQVFQGPLPTALALLEAGFSSIAVSSPDGGGASPGKRPVERGWGETRQTAEGLKAAYRKFPGANVGLVLGPGRGPDGSWLIDVEGDGPEAEDSRRKLFGGEEVATMSWGSERGRHDLLRVDPARMAPILAALSGCEAKGASGVYHLPELPGLELRVGGLKPDGTPKQLQSVCAPSRSAFGFAREWIGRDLADAPDAFYQALEAIAEARRKSPTAPTATPRTVPRRRPLAVPSNRDRAVAYLRACPPAISGQSGHDTAFAVVCQVGPGFDLSPDECLAVLREWNATCQPPWSDSELMHKVENVYQVEPRRGWKLEERDAGAHGQSPRVEREDLAEWATHYATRPEHEYLGDRGFMAALAHAQTHAPAEYAQVRAAFKSAGFSMKMLDSGARETAKQVKAEGKRKLSVARAQVAAKAQATTHGGAAGGGSGEGAIDPRVEIENTVDEHIGTRKTIEALAGADNPNVYASPSGILMRLIATPRSMNDRSAGSHADPVPVPRLMPHTEATLRDVISAVASYTETTVSLSETGTPEETVRQVRPPKHLARTILENGEWPGFKVASGIVEAPTLRPDGSVLDTPGPDKATGLIYVRTSDYPPMPESPTLDDARAAAGRLLELVNDFPFVDSDHKSAWLALLLTTACRSAVAGSVPFFTLDSSTRGTGKSLLADVVSLICNGRSAARMTLPTDDEAELRKQLFATAISGEGFVLWDDLGAGARIGGKTLNAAITSSTIIDRLLGQSRMMTADWRAVACGTGNNTLIVGDLSRRMLMIRLQTNMERPESRTGFAIPNLLAHVRENRASLLIDALTIVRAYIVAGRPDQKLSAFGSFEEWSGLIRSAIVWTTGCDPLKTRDAIDESDTETNDAAALLVALADSGLASTGATAAEIARAVNDEVQAAHKDRREVDPRLRSLVDVMTEATRNGEPMTAKLLGYKLRALKDRTLGGYRLTSWQDLHSKVARWKVERVVIGPDGGPDRGPDPEPDEVRATVEAIVATSPPTSSPVSIATAPTMAPVAVPASNGHTGSNGTSHNGPMSYNGPTSPSDGQANGHAPLPPSSSPPGHVGPPGHAPAPSDHVAHAPAPPNPASVPSTVDPPPAPTPVLQFDNPPARRGYRTVRI
jgi:hypothetical protein